MTVSKGMFRSKEGIKNLLSNRVHVADSILDFEKLDIDAVEQGMGLCSYVAGAVREKGTAYFLYDTNMRLGVGGNSHDCGGVKEGRHGV